MKRTSRWNAGPVERLETLVRLDQYGRTSPGPALQALRALKAVARAAASDPDPHHRVVSALERLRSPGRATGRRTR